MGFSSSPPVAASAMSSPSLLCPPCLALVASAKTPWQLARKKVRRAQLGVTPGKMAWSAARMEATLVPCQLGTGTESRRGRNHLGRVKSASRPSAAVAVHCEGGVRDD